MPARRPCATPLSEEVAYAAGEGLDVVASTIDLVDQNEMLLREQRLIQMSAKHVSDDDVRRYMTDLMTRAH